MRSTRSPDGAAAKSGASAGRWRRGPRFARRWRSIRVPAMQSCLAPTPALPHKGGGRCVARMARRRNPGHRLGGGGAVPGSRAVGAPSGPRLLHARIGNRIARALNRRSRRVSPRPCRRSGRRVSTPPPCGRCWPAAAPPSSWRLPWLAPCEMTAADAAGLAGTPRVRACGSLSCCGSASPGSRMLQPMRIRASSRNS